MSNLPVATLQASDSVNFMLSFSNEGETPLPLLDFYLPPLNTRIFSCDIDGEPIPFVGQWVFFDPDVENYVNLSPGETIEFVVDMSEYYEISREGTLNCFYKGFLSSTDEIEGEILPVQIYSNTASIEVKQDAQITRRRDNEVTPPPVSDSCTEDQLKALGEMEKKGRKCVCESLDCLEKLQPQPDDAKGNAYFKKIFGPSQSKKALDKVKDTFDKIKTDLQDDSPTNYECVNRNRKACREGGLAFVNHEDRLKKPNRIYLCPKFFTFRGEFER